MFRSSIALNFIFTENVFVHRYYGYVLMITELGGMLFMVSIGLWGWKQVVKVNFMIALVKKVKEG
jgi:hypothetical protein